MKLFQIWNAREAFTRLASLKKPPKLAYRLMKYERKFNAEVDACQKQSDKLVYEISGEPVGTAVQILPGTQEFAEFVTKLNEFLDNESDLDVVGVSMDDLIEGLDAEKGNVLSEYDLALLEVFFTDKPKADLKLVG